MRFLAWLVCVTLATAVGGAEVNALKARIVELARSYAGQGDADFSKQNTLNGLVAELLREAPQPPLRERVGVVVGAWRQIWGPYDYRNEKRGVDPELGVDEIYQVVFAGGYYYNASCSYPGGDRTKEQIGLLRGEYRLDPQRVDSFRVKFTRFPGTRSRVPGRALWELPALAEAGQLPNEISIVPTVVVRLFFGGGRLREAYTDQDLRITYGSSGKPGAPESIYVMERVSR